MQSESIASLLNNASKRLLNTSTDYNTALLDSELILCNVINCSKIFLFSHPEEIISARLIKKFYQAIESRKNSIPISYLTNQKEFYSRNFYVNNSVLIPRPESELIIDTVLEQFRKLPSAKSPFLLADLGTGSGCLVITLACELENENIKFWGFDNSKKALKIARKNYTSINPSAAVEFKFLDYIAKPLPRKFDIIVANPPYIPSREIKNLMDDVKDYEPIEALDGGINGLVYYYKIFDILGEKLKPNGFAVIEMYAQNSKKIESIFSKKYALKVLTDSAGLKRCLLITSPQ